MQSLVPIIAASAVWLVIGMVVGAVFFPDIRIKEQRVEVPVEVEKVVVKTEIVEKKVEVPVYVDREVPRTDKVVEKAFVPVLVPWPEKKGATGVMPANWGKLEKGMSRSDVIGLLGQPLKTSATEDGSYYMYYDPQDGRVAYVKMQAGTFSDSALEWNAPVVSNPEDYAKTLLDLAEKALQAGDLALAHAYASAAQRVAPSPQEAQALIEKIRNLSPAGKK